MPDPTEVNNQSMPADADATISGGGLCVGESSLVGPIDPSLLAACIHCGLCLPACPTYLATGREMESPRGRIYLLTQWQTGEQPLTPRLAEHIDTCLGCFGCQTACPSGVKYESILNQARPHIAKMRPKRMRRLMRLVFSKILPDYPKLHALGKMMRLWQSIGGQRIFSKIPLFRKTMARLQEWQEMMPKVPEYKPVPRQGWLSGEKRGEANLFIGCVMDVFYNHVNNACQRLMLLQRQVVRVPEQTCCGALAFHAGDEDITKNLAKRNIEMFERTQGPIVITAAGCGAMLKEYGELFHDDDEWRDRAHDFSSRVQDITEFLAAHEFIKEPKPLGKKVAYHAACHLAHAQNVRQAPEELLNRLNGVELKPLVEAEHCCGSAGIYNLIHTEISMDVLQRKIEYIKQTGADTLVTTNPGCMLQIEYGLREAGLPIKVMHLAQLLDEAYGA
jgi:glycolate oxidase iron-sulfur subunit